MGTTAGGPDWSRRRIMLHNSRRGCWKIVLFAVGVAIAAPAVGLPGSFPALGMPDERNAANSQKRAEGKLEAKAVEKAAACAEDDQPKAAKRPDTAVSKLLTQLTELEPK